MSTSKYRVPNELYYSEIYGGGIYEWNGQTVQDPLGGDRGEGRVSPLLTSLLSGETFFLKRLPGDARDRFRTRVLLPPRNEHILWPSDMVHLEEEQREGCSLFVAQSYTPAPAEQEGTEALLFPYGGYPRMVDGLRRLSQIESPSWKVREIRRMAAEIARALESLNRSGYLYADIHLSRIYFSDDDAVFLDFSNLVFPLRDSVGRGADTACRVEQGAYPLEFADPALVRGLTPHVDLHSQNYSLCALFFYLFLGRYPYDGRLLTGYKDDTPQGHYVKFRDYHKMPVFIFDPEDTQNSLGAFWEEQQVIELWEELPGELREMFVRTLRRGNAERTDPVNNPTPSTWLRCFRELGWYDDKDDKKETEGIAYE